MQLFLLILLLTAGSLSAGLIKEAMIFPIDYQQGIYHITEDHPYSMIPQISGEGHILRKAPLFMVLELPRQVKIVRCSTRVALQKDLKYSMVAPADKNAPTRTWRIQYPDYMINAIYTAGFGWRGGFNCYIQADQGSAGLSAPVRYYFEQNQKILKEKQFILKILPKLTTSRHQFKKFKLGITEFTAAGHRDMSILKKQVKFWTDLAVRPENDFDWENFRMTKEVLQFLDKNCTLQAGSYAMPHSTMIFQDTDCEDLGFFDKQHLVSRPGVPHFVDAKGNIHRGAICPQYLMKDPEGLFYGEYIRRSLSKMRRYAPGIKAFVIDYEPTADGGTCNECLKAFAAFAKLNKIPRREEITPGQPLNREWKKYKIHQNKIIMDKIVAGVRKYFPDMKFSFCCTELRPPEKIIDSWDAVDVGAQDHQVDYFSFMNYCTGPEYYYYLKYAVDNLKHAKAYSWIDPAEESERFFVRYTPKKIRQNIVATVALRAMGIVFYPMDTMDGQVMTHINDTCQVLAELEDIYWSRDLSSQMKWSVMNSQKINVFDSKGHFQSVEYPDVTSKIRVHLHEKDGRFVCSILNYAEDRAYIRLQLPLNASGSTFSGIHDLIHHRTYTGVTPDQMKNGLIVEVPAGDASVILFSNQPRNFAGIQQKEIIQELQKASAKFAANTRQYQPQQQGIKGFQWRIFKKKTMPVLIHGDNYITINAPENGRVEEWKCGQFIPVGQPGGTLAEIFFYDPQQAVVREYTVKEVNLTGKNPYLILQASVSPGTSAVGGANPLRNLILEKKYELHADGNLEVTDTFINPTSRNMPIGFRIRSIPHSVWEARPLPKITLNGQPTPADVYCLPRHQINWFGIAGCKTVQNADTVDLVYKNSSIKISFPEAAGCYFWKSQTNATAEPLYNNFTLKSKNRRSFTQKFYFEARK